MSDAMETPLGVLNNLQKFKVEFQLFILFAPNTSNRNPQAEVSVG